MWKTTGRFLFSSFLLIVLFVPVAQAQSSHADVVASKKTILLSRGEDLSGPCGAFKITREVAADVSVRAEGWGLVHSTGNGCSIAGDVYRADTVMQPNGFTIDLLTRSESDNGNTSNNAAFNIPAWDQTGNQEPSNWRAPLASNLVQGPVPPAPPAPTPTPYPMPLPVPTLDLSGIYDRMRSLEDANERRYLDLSRRVDAVSSQVTAVSVQVREHDEKTSKFIAFFTDGKTITTIVGLVGGYFAHVATN